MTGKSTGFYSTIEARYRLKSLYRSAIGDQRYRHMSPPYFVGNRLIYMASKIRIRTVEGYQTMSQKYLTIQVVNYQKIIQIRQLTLFQKTIGLIVCCVHWSNMKHNPEGQPNAVPML